MSAAVMEIVPEEEDGTFLIFDLNPI